MRETKFKIGEKPWLIEQAYYRDDRPVVTIKQHSEITEIRITIMEEGEKEVPYHNGEEYPAEAFATREEAVEYVRGLYKRNIEYLEEQAEFFRKALEELENE